MLRKHSSVDRAITSGVYNSWNRFLAFWVTRDFIDVRDLARALVAVARNGEGIFNVGSGLERSISQLVHEFFESANLRPQICTESEIARGVQRNYGDITRLRNIGFEPLYEIHRSVADVLDYYDRIWQTGRKQTVSLAT